MLLTSGTDIRYGVRRRPQVQAQVKRVCLMAYVWPAQAVASTRTID
ncbi:uncharacterized protein METZ01_LOCUS149769 [marine metagenome]|uniref:Uncharacterized protein n=1 Tax=marine metagenome TaxID=408172 RepID=A0A382A5U4_9ZZZZ